MRRKGRIKMEKKKSEFYAWLKSHKKQLIVAGISVGVIICVVMGIKNKDAIIKLWASLDKALEKTPKNTPMRIPTQQIEDTASDLICPRVYTLPQEAFDVSQHIRMLPRNQHHSAKKAAEAMSLGIDLLPNQTIVDTYTKYAA